MEDADLDAAVDTLMDGAMFNSGQCCCGIERIYVNENLYDDFVEKAVAFASSYKLEAVPQGSQTEDTECGTLRLLHTGKKEITGSGSAVKCWN